MEASIVPSMIQTKEKSPNCPKALNPKPKVPPVFLPRAEGLTSAIFQGTDQISSKAVGTVAGSSCNAQSLDLAAREIAQKQFDMLVSEAKYDQRVFEIYLQNRQTNPRGECAEH